MLLGNVESKFIQRNSFIHLMPLLGFTKTNQTMDQFIKTSALSQV